MTDYQKARAELDATLEALGVTLAATFVPQSQSRNSNEKRPTLNWRVVVVRSKRPQYACDYTQGIAHAPGYPQTLRKSPNLAANERHAAERGRYPQNWESAAATHDKPLTPPKLAEVLSSLLLDSTAFGQTFEDWANDYGYDTDSREAERTYNACRDAGAAMAKLFTGQEIETLRELCDLAGL